MKRETLKFAFPYTIPVLTGYLFLGMAFGVLMKVNGLGLWLTLLMSLAVYAGSLQYAGISFLTAAFNPVNVLIMSLVINARHLFYGVSMLEKYNRAGKGKSLLIFGLTDETFSIVCSGKTPEKIDEKSFYLCITLLNYSYWVVSSLLGNALGNLISFNTEGIEFVLTALFVVIFLNQWLETKNRIPAITGLCCSIICLIIFGPDNFIIPAMISIFVVLIIFRKYSCKGLKMYE